MGRVVLCADTESLIRPMLIGLDDGSLDNKDWLVSIPDAMEARAEIASSEDIDQVWVVSSDQVEAINLVAAIRKDAEELPIYLITFECTGSLMSRLRGLSISGIWDVEEFCQRFDREVAHRSLMSEVASLEIVPGEGVKAKTTNNPRELLAAKRSEEAKGRCRSEKDEEPAEERIEGKCFTVAALGGGGGVGRSAFVALAACMTQARGFRTVVVDADLQFGDQARLLPDSIHVPMDGLLDGEACLDDPSLDTQSEHPVVICAPARIESSEKVLGRIQDVVRACSERFDVVYVDASPNWGDDNAWLVENSDCSIFVLDQRASVIRGAQRVVDLCMRMGVATGSFVYALNRCGKEAIFSAMDIANVMQGANVVELADGGPEVEEHLGSGLTRELSASRNALVGSVGDAIGDILPASAFFAGKPEWTRPEDARRHGQHGKESRFAFLPERRERRRRRSKRQGRESRTLDAAKMLDGSASTVMIENL